jgi:hypothetical protein
VEGLGGGLGRIFFKYANTNSSAGVKIQTGTGQNNVSVFATVVPVQIVGNSTTASLTVTLGNGSPGSLDPIQGALTLTGRAGGNNNLIVNDQAGPPNTNRIVTITATGFTRTFPGVLMTSVSITGFQTEMFNVSGTTTVQGTASGTSTTINVFGGGLPVNLGLINPNTDQGTLQPIQGPITIASGNSDPHTFPSVSINDLADTSARTVFITSTQITGLTAPGAPINFPTSSAETLGIEGPFVGGSTFNIDGTPAIDLLQVIAPGTGDTVNVHAVPAAGAPGFPFTALVVSQTVNVGQNHSLQAIQGTVEVANAVFKNFFPLQGIPLANVKVDDSADTQQQTVTIGAGGITGPSGPITITTGSAISVTYQGGVSSTGHNAYTITGTPATTTLTVSTPGPDTVNVQATAAGTTTIIQGGSGSHQTFNIGSTNDATSTLDGIQGPVTVNGGTGGFTTLNINDQGSTTPHTYTQTSTTFSRSGAATITFFNITTLNPNKGPRTGSSAQAQDLTLTDQIQVGDLATLSGQLVTDNPDAQLTLEVDWSDGSDPDLLQPGLDPFSLQHSYDQPGTYTVRGIWTDLATGESNSRDLTITVTPGGGGGGEGGSGGGSGSSFRLPGVADDAVANLAGSLVRAAQGSPAGKAAVQAFFDAAGASFNQQTDPMRLPEQPALAGAGLRDASASDAWAGSEGLDLFFASLSDLLPDWNARKEVVVG